MCYLNTHPSQYNISSQDICISLVTGLSGAPYGARHAALANELPFYQALTHRFIALLESIPILGALFALIESISFTAQKCFKDPSHLSGTAQSAPSLKGRIEPYNKKLALPSPQAKTPSTRVHPTLLTQPQDTGAKAALSSPKLEPFIPSALNPRELAKEQPPPARVKPVPLTQPYDVGAKAAPSSPRLEPSAPSPLGSPEPEAVGELEAGPTDRKKEAGPETPLKPSWRKAPIGQEEAFRKMYKNAKKALEERRNLELAKEQAVDPLEEEESSSPTSIPFKDIDLLPPSEEALPSLEELQSTGLSLTPLKLTYHTDNVKKKGEDVSFVEHMEQGILAGVIDGHGGDQVAQLIEEHFPKTFKEFLKTTSQENPQGKPNIHQAFELSIEAIHQMVSQDISLNRVGAVAVFSFIDPVSHLIYTATLADSEASIYRRITGVVKKTPFHFIPLSPIRDWTLLKEKQRAEKVELSVDFPTMHKYARVYCAVNPAAFAGERIGLNVSRSIGDAFHKGLGRKPKITVQRPKRGDFVLLSSDGLRGTLSESEIVQRLISDESNPLSKKVSLGQRTARLLHPDYDFKDDTTVILFEVE